MPISRFCQTLYHDALPAKRADPHQQFDMPLTFEIFDAESGAFRDTDEISDDIAAEFDGILDAHESRCANSTPSTTMSLAMTTYVLPRLSGVCGIAKMVSRGIK